MAKLGISLPQGVEVEETDFTLGRIFDSGVYPVTIQSAYTSRGDTGATALVVNTTTLEGRSFTVREYLTSGKDKDYATTYKDSRSGKQVPLPGYVIGNSIAVLAVGKQIGELEQATKVVEVYDFEERKDIPTEVPMLTELVGKKIVLGILKRIENVRQKGDDGKYVDTSKTRETNTVHKVFNSDGFTAAELRNEVDEPKYIIEWKKINAGKVVDRSKNVKDSGATQGSPRTDRKDRAKLTKSLFDE